MALLCTRTGGGNRRHPVLGLQERENGHKMCRVCWGLGIGYRLLGLCPKIKMVDSIHLQGERLLDLRSHVAQIQALNVLNLKDY